MTDTPDYINRQQEIKKLKYNQEIFLRIQSILVDKIFINASDIEIHSHLKDDLELDSLGITEVIMEIEKEFEIGIPDEYIDNAIFVFDLVDLVDKAII